MINNYQDVMAICRTYGNLDLFITFTCNTNWLEIQRELRKVRVYKHEDNPDIITRVLRTKLLDMLKFIKFSIPSGKKIASEMILSIFISFLSCLSFTIFICFCFCTSQQMYAQLNLKKEAFHILTFWFGLPPNLNVDLLIVLTQLFQLKYLIKMLILCVMILFLSL